MPHTATLVWITPNAESVIGFCARVSNPQNQKNYETVPRLLSYCIRHNHWSIFEMASMCVEVRTTRAISAQLLRHRSLSFQEFSTRYSPVLDPPVLPDLRLQDSRNRQNSIPMEDGKLRDTLEADIQEHLDAGMRLYHDLLKAGIAREVARDILPLAAPTTLYVSGTVRSWIHYTQVRCGNGTQREHQQLATSIRDILYTQCPSVAAALQEAP